MRFTKRNARARSSSLGRRDVTTVPAQALYLMNSSQVIEQSLHTARRVLADASAVDSGDRADLAYLLILSRRPSDDERARAVRFVNRTLETLPAGDDQRKANAWSGLCQALFASAEFRYLE